MRCNTTFADRRRLIGWCRYWQVRAYLLWLCAHQREEDTL